MKPHEGGPQNDETAQQPASRQGGNTRQHHTTNPRATQQAGRHELGRDSADFAATTVGYPVLITPPEAAEILAIAERTLAKYTASGAVPSRKLGSLRRYVRAELTAWIDAGCPMEPGAGEAIRQRMRGGAA